MSGTSITLSVPSSSVHFLSSFHPMAHGRISLLVRTCKCGFYILGDTSVSCMTFSIFHFSQRMAFWVTFHPRTSYHRPTKSTNIYVLGSTRVLLLHGVVPCDLNFPHLARPPCYSADFSAPHSGNDMRSVLLSVSC